VAGGRSPHPPSLPVDSLAGELARLQGASDPLSQTARLLLEHALADNTLASYMNKFAQFAKFCRVVAHQHPLAPSTDTVLRYQAHMFRTRRVHPRNWGPYLAAINRAHDDFGLPAPARHRIVHAASRGALRLAEAQPVFSARPVRRPLPAPLAVSALTLAGRATSAAGAAPALAVVTATILMLRASSLAALLGGHVAFHADGSVAFTVTRHKARLSTTLIRVLPPASPDLARFISLLRQLVACTPPSAPLFDFGAASPSAGLTAAVRACFTATGWTLPAGTSLTGHSCRGGGATASLAVGVHLAVTMQWGDWRSLTSVVRYLDPLCPPSSAAMALFGHLRRT
jgi:hypothetical protein